MPPQPGMIRPLDILIPEGTILNASYPAATTYGNHLCPNNADALMRALGPVIPDRVTAEWNELLCSLSTGTDPRHGGEPIGMIDASGGVLEQDYEIFEQQTRHVLKKHEYWVDSAGSGEWRGGLGVKTEINMGGENVRLVTFGDGDVEASRGTQGGKEGTLNVIKLRYPDGEEYICTTKDMVRGVPAGTVYYQQAGGGGGWGNPGDRPAEKVLADVRNGVLSVEAAREDYGVAVSVDDWTVDQEETKCLRSAE